MCTVRFNLIILYIFVSYEHQLFMLVFFSPVQMQEEMKENFFSFSDEEQSQEAKETVTAKLMLKKQV